MRINRAIVLIYNQILSTDMERSVWQSAARVNILNLEMKPSSNYSSGLMSQSRYHLS